MSKKIVSILTAMTVFAPAVPICAKTESSIDNMTENQLQEVYQTVEDVSSIVSDVLGSIEVEKQVEEISYTYVEQPVYTPIVYETTAVEQAPVIETVQRIDDTYQIALTNYENALAAYTAASELVETTSEQEVEIVEEIMDEEGNVSTVTRTEIQTITETSFAGDVDTAQAALDAAAAELEAAQSAHVTETVVEDQQIVSETVSYAAAENQCGDDVTWTLSGMGVLKISGSGAMYDYTLNEHAPWYSDKLAVNEVVVESGVTRIGNYAFDHCNRITSVTLADTVTEIGKYAFNYNSGLTEIVIPDSVTVIEDYAFNWCNHLVDIELGNGLTTISQQAFYSCQALETIVLPASVKTIGKGAFKECTGLTSITLNSGLQTISAAAFTGCTSLQTIDIPSTVTSLGSNMFEKCAALMNINVHALNTKYSSVDGVLYNKAKTTLIQCPIGKIAVTIPDSVNKIGNYGFYQCSNLTSIALPEMITSIGTKAFYQCNGLKDVVLPDSVKTIGSSVFSMSRNVETVDLGNTVTAIPSQAFFSCDSLKSVVLPNTLTSIAANAFDSCPVLTDVYYRGTESDWTSKGLFNFADNVTMHYMADYVKQSQHTLSLEGNIEVNFYMELDEELQSDENAAILFTIDGTEYEYQISEGTPVGKYLRYSVDVTSVQMASDILVRIVSSHGNTGYSETYSAKTYCDNQLAKSSISQTLRTLLESLLNYGGYAQTFFKVNLDHLANADLEDTDVSDATADMLAPYASVSTGSEEGLTLRGSTLTLDSLTTIKHYFIIGSGHSIGDYTFMLGDTELTPIQSGSMYYVEIPDISSRDLDTAYTVNVGDFSITYSALSYAYNQMMKSTSQEALKDACRALYKYNQAANAHFG